MLKASVAGLKYHRLLTDHADRDLSRHLKNEFDYSFIISYGGFEDEDYELVNKQAGLIDLSSGIESAFSGFQATCRKQVRQANKNSELAFHFGVKEFCPFYEFYTECEKERGWFPIPPDELKNSLVIYATYKHEPIAGMSCYSSGKRLRLGRIFSKRRSTAFDNDRKVMFSMASRRIVFDFCKYGVEGGFSTLDMGGIDIERGEKSGIGDFKMSFGCKIVPVVIGRHVSAKFAEKAAAIRAMGLDIT
jgi:hypothetical protein